MAKNLEFFAQNMYVVFLQKMDHNIGFRETRQLAKSQKIVIVTSTSGANIMVNMF
jgi:hypothetical protein